jgi:hypothetical protein
MFALAVALGGAGAASAAPRAAPRAATTAIPTVVVIAVPDLRWSDLASMPDLASYASTSSVGDLSVRGEPDASRCTDGLLTLAAGNRADAGGATGCVISPADRGRLRGLLRSDRYGSDIAALGTALHGAARTTVAVGPSAALMLGDLDGRVSDSVPVSEFGSALGRGDVIAVVDPGLYDATSARPAAARVLDATVAGQLAKIPAGDLVIVAGTSDARTGGPHLHAVIVHGPGWRHVQLTSASAGAGFVQLVDLAPTILQAAGVPVPASMIGRPMTDSSSAAKSAAAYSDIDRHAAAGRRVDGLTRTGFGVAVILALVLAVAARRYGSRPADLAAVWVGRVAVGVPLASFLVQLVPWWRWSAAGYYLAVLGISLALGALTAVAGHRDRRWALAAVPLVTVIVLVVDQLVGAPLQTSAPLGNQPLVAGRFTGMGNIAFACLGAGALVAAGLLAGRLQDGGRRRPALGVAAAICLIALVADVAPPLGDDFGGVLGLAPAVVLLLALLAGVRLSVRRVATTVIGIAVLAVAVAAADYARPAADRTHIGTFAGQVIHGGAGRVISRKLYSETHSLGNVAVTGSVVLLVIVAVVARQGLVTRLRALSGLAESMAAVAVLAVLGSVLNDSGIVVAQFAAGIALLAVVGAGLVGPPGDASVERSDLAGGRPPLPAPAAGRRRPS